MLATVDARIPTRGDSFRTEGLQRLELADMRSAQEATDSGGLQEDTRRLPQPSPQATDEARLGLGEAGYSRQGLRETAVDRQVDTRRGVGSSPTWLVPSSLVMPASYL